MALTNYNLSTNEITQITNFKNAGQYDLAYRYIADRISTAVVNGSMSVETQRWFLWAAEINGNAPTLINKYARTFTIMSGALDHVTISNDDFQSASNDIAEAVLGKVLNDGYVPSTPSSIVLEDVAQGAISLGIPDEDFAGTMVGWFLFDTPTAQKLIDEDPANATTWQAILARCEQTARHGLLGAAIATGLITDAIADVYVSIAEKLDASLTVSSPLVLDLDGGGIDLTNIANSSTHFDVNNNGFAEKTGWVTAGEGILFVDQNRDNFVQSNELLGNSTGHANGFLALAEYDSNADGKITAEDARYSDIKVWVDTNGNGFSEEGEIATLNDLSITEIDLNFNEADYQIEGNSIGQESTFIINGNTRGIVDVYFQTDQTNSVYNLQVEIDPDVWFLPALKGYGILPDISIQASIDNSGMGNLKSLLQDFASLTFADAFTATTEIIADARAIMYRWADVDGVDPNSRGSATDAQELEFLEALMGQNWLQRGVYSDPRGPEAGGLIEEAFQLALNTFTAKLMAQTAAGDLLAGNYYYNTITDSFEGITGLNLDLLSDLQTEASALANTALRELFWQNVTRMIEYTVGTSNLDSGSLTALEDAITGSDASLDLSGIVESLPYHHPVGVDEAGTSSADTMTGSSGDDSLNGREGNDILHGMAGNDYLLGGDGDDTIEGGQGHDLMLGASGNDVYHIASAEGFDTIVDSAGTADKIQFSSGIDINDLTLTRLSSNDLLIEIDNGTDTPSNVTIEDFFTNGGSIETLEFSDSSTFDLDGQSWTLNGTNGQDVLYGVEYGGLNTDTINGGSDGDTIYGYSGADILNGEDGNDYIYGGDGNDTIDGGNGVDTLYGDDGDDVLIGGSGDDRVTGGAGNDAYYFTSGHDIYSDSSGTDEIYVASGFTSASAKYFRFGNDLQIVFDEGNSIYIQGQYSSGKAIETLHYDGGPDINLSTVATITQGADTNDTLSGTSSTDTLYGGAGDDRILGNGGSDTLYGGSGDDSLNGGSGDDHLYGDAGNDTISDNSGHNTYYYISGHDTFSAYNSAAEEVKLLYGWTLDDLKFSRYETADANLVIEISDANSITLVSQLAAGTHFSTLELLDNTSYSLYDFQVTTYGSAVNDYITGVSGASPDDIVYGYAGNDVVYGDTGNDLIYGGDDADKLYGEDGNDTIYGDAGNDTLNGGDGNDYLHGGEGNDTLYGGLGDDTFVYTSGLDVVEDGTSGAGGSDTLHISGGTTINDISFSNIGSYDVNITIDAGVDVVRVDYLRYSNAARHIENITFDDGFSAHLETYASWTNGTSAADTINGTSGVDTIIAKDGNDEVYAGDGDDQVHGGNGNDILFGGNGADELHGGSGMDFIQGDAGTDILFGGEGGDIFFFTGYNEADVVKDFSTEEGDILNIANLLTSYNSVTDDISDFVSLNVVGQNTAMYVDRDGADSSYGSEQVALLENIQLTDLNALISNGQIAIS